MHFNIFESWQWRSVSELQKLECLEDLKFRANSVLEQQNLQTGIQLVIARIATLKHLNGTLIGRSERLGAEYDYLKLFASEWKNAEEDTQKMKEFIINHPRFATLIESKNYITRIVYSIFYFTITNRKSLQGLGCRTLRK